MNIPEYQQQINIGTKKTSNDVSSISKGLYKYPSPNNLGLETVDDNKGFINQAHIIETFYTNSLDLNSEDIDHLIRLRTAHEYTDALNKLKNIIETINGTLSSKKTSELKNWVIILKKLHPKLDADIQQLKYLSPISEEIGSRTLGYSPDTQSLELKNWKGIAAQPIRVNLRTKLKQNNLNLILDTYKNLNERVYTNTSSEYFLERERNPNISAHDYHLAGDTTYPKIIAKTNTSILSNISSSLGDAIRLINYLIPINNSEQYQNEPININIENTDISVDNRGTIIIQHSIVNNDSLKPKTNI